MSNKKKIIGFDSWLGGARSYQILLPALEAECIDMKLVHISSWGNNVSCASESKVGDLICRDISFYGKNNFEGMLDIEKPDVVILTSTDTFAHRAIIRYCAQRSIPTLNLYHGVRSVIDAEDELGSPNIPFLAYIKNISSRLLKLIIHTFPVYMLSLWKTKASFKDWIRFFTDVLHFAIGRDPAYVRASNDSETSKCAVYVDADVKHAMSCYGFQHEDVLVVGNPDFSHFGMQQSLINSWSHPLDTTKKSIMYIETGFSSVGFYFASTQEFIEHLLHTSSSLDEQGFDMLLKMKPGQLNEKEILKGISGSQIKLVGNETFLESLTSCSGCIAERTSLALLPALMGMPLFLAKYGPLEPVAYGSVLKSYPQSSELFDISDLTTVLNQFKSDLDVAIVKEWIDTNSGPVPFEEMPERVVALISSMIT